MSAPPVPPPRAAGLAALADRCVMCGLCLPHCPTYRLDRTEAESPRGRIAYVRALATGALAPTAAGDIHLDHCLGCRRCEAACPAGVAYGDLLALARQDQAARRSIPRRTRRLLGLLARPRRLDRLLALYRLAGGLLPARWRPPLPRPPAPAPRPAPPALPEGAPHWAVFEGCIARAYEAAARAALVRLFAATGVALHWPGGQGCCGTAAAHAGDAAGAAILADANRRAFAGAARVLTLATGCHDGLARSLPAPTEDALAALAARAGSLRFRDAGGHRVALHLPCSQRAVVHSDGALQRLLSQVPGLDLVVLPDTGCCGAAGLQQVLEPARAATLRAPLEQALAASGATELLSANLGCRLHLAGGTRLPVRHPLEFLAEHLA